MKTRKQHTKRHTFLSTPISEAFKPIIANYARNILAHVDTTDFFNSVDKLAHSSGVPHHLHDLVISECREQAKANRQGDNN